MAEVQRVRLSSGICSLVVLPVASSGIGSPVAPLWAPRLLELGRKNSKEAQFGGLRGARGVSFGGGVCQRLACVAIWIVKGWWGEAC